MLALVLSRSDIKEYDQVVSLYTEKQGRRDCTVRGVKKITSKNTSHLEPGALIELGIAKGKERDIVTSVQIEEYFPQIRKDYFRSLSAMWALQCVEQWFRVPESDPHFFSFLISWFFHINSREKISPYVFDAFVIRTLGFLGFHPVLDRCVECEKKSLNETMFFSSEKGGVVCAGCKDFFGLNSEQGMVMDMKIRHAFQSIVTSSWEECSELFREKNFYHSLHKAVYSFMIYHSVLPLKDWHNLAKISNFFEYTPAYSETQLIS